MGTTHHRFAPRIAPGKRAVLAALCIVGSGLAAGQALAQQNDQQMIDKVRDELRQAELRQLQPRVVTQEDANGLLSKVQREPLTRERLSDIVKRLGSDDWATREAASRELTSKSVALPDIEAMLRTKDLSSEQRQRLQGVGFEAFSRSDRGAMGVSFDARQGQDGIGVGGCEPGYHSREVLRAGDVIRTIDGNPVNDIWEVRPNVITKDPGETVELEVVRDGEVQLVTLRLGSFQTLRRTNPIDDATMLVAWTNRVRRLVGETGNGVVQVPALSAVEDAADPVMVAFRRRLEQAGGNAADLGENGNGNGGKARGKAGLDPSLLTLQAGGRHARVSQESREVFRLGTDNNEQFAEMLETLTNQQRLWMAQQRKLEERLNEPALADAEREKIKRNLQHIEASLREVSEQREMLEKARLTQEEQAKANEKDDR